MTAANMRELLVIIMKQHGRMWGSVHKISNYGQRIVQVSWKCPAPKKQVLCACFVWPGWCKHTLMIITDLALGWHSKLRWTWHRCLENLVWSGQPRDNSLQLLDKGVDLDHMDMPHCLKNPIVMKSNYCMCVESVDNSKRSGKFNTN